MAMPINIVIQQSRDSAHIAVAGSIDERAAEEFAKIANGLPSKLVFNFRGIVALNSFGVDAWITFYKAIYKNRFIVFEDCTPEIVTQINMTPIFRGPAVIQSVFANYECPTCAHKQQQLYVRGQNLPAASSDPLPEVNCQACGKETAMDQEAEDFFAWIEA